MSLEYNSIQRHTIQYMYLVPQFHNNNLEDIFLDRMFSVDSSSQLGINHFHFHSWPHLYSKHQLDMVG